MGYYTVSYVIFNKPAISKLFILMTFKCYIP